MNIFSAVKAILRGSDMCTPEELHRMLQGNESFVLLDVRRDEELRKARIERAVHVPLDALEARIGELEPLRSSEIVVMCHHGIRSRMAQQFLKQHGFTRVRNLAGGIGAYADVDPSVGKY